DAATGQPLTPRHDAGDVLAARFTANGDAVQAVLADGSVVNWEFPPIVGDPADVSRLAALRSGRHIHPSRTLALLPFDDAAKGLASLRESFPSSFGSDPASLSAWRTAQLQTLPANVKAAFTLPELTRKLAAEPGNAALFAERAEAHSTLQNYTAAEA